MNSAMERQEILLESGTNEVEIIEFYLGGQSFGINVHKLREIVPYEPEAMTALPESGPSMKGMLLLRGKTVPLVDLGSHLRKRGQGEPAGRQVVLVCEFNREVNSFLVDGVNQIHRISWKDVKPLDEFFTPYKPRFTGCITVDGREVMIVDLEHVISEIFPEQTILGDGERAEEVDDFKRESRQEVRILVAEDSTIIRNQITSILKSSGYVQVTAFINGEECYNGLNMLKAEAVHKGKDFREFADLLISDIEMPSMDGLTLCRKIKSDSVLKNLTVLMFSSLINEQLAHKCQEVGADGHISKPQIHALVKMLDEYCLK
ncbi:chemotaxis protein CheV [Geoalkalibacter halelectricus]|uniref:Chemotaxis protein n=1 Tax=Geoalkalibacter halelectricus TaxID=2847045 RepID=A0ABY5ZLP0_9BACT|nr:chemotaxis protein [Geoalkalibacter halelectricus]MDO3378600.1 chemotaxis protein [Geoalkalibacter halelectricus]UWZ80087.1 chemotaxis protein [Geoalkalibacter halelectricus]